MIISVVSALKDETHIINVKGETFFRWHGQERSF